MGLETVMERRSAKKATIALLKLPNLSMNGTTEWGCCDGPGNCYGKKICEKSYDCPPDAVEPFDERATEWVWAFRVKQCTLKRKMDCKQDCLSGWKEVGTIGRGCCASLGDCGGDMKICERPYDCEDWMRPQTDPTDTEAVTPETDSTDSEAKSPDTDLTEAKPIAPETDLTEACGTKNKAQCREARRTCMYKKRAGCVTRPRRPKPSGAKPRPSGAKPDAATCSKLRGGRCKR